MPSRCEVVPGQLVDEVRLGRPGEADSGAWNGHPATGDVAQITDQDGGLARHVAGMDPTPAIDAGDRRCIGVVLGIECHAETLAAVVDGGDAQLLGAAETQDPLFRLDLDRPEFAGHWRGRRFPRQSAPAPLRQSSAAGADNAGCRRWCVGRRRWAIWPRGLEQHQAAVRRSGKYPPAPSFLRQGFMVARRVEAEHAQLEAVLPFRLAVTAAAVAAELREDRHDLRLEVDRRRIFAIQLLQQVPALHPCRAE